MTYMLKNIKMCQFEYSKFNIRYSTLKLFKFRTTNNEQRTMNNDSRPEAQPNGAKLNLKPETRRTTNLASRIEKWFNLTRGTAERSEAKPET
jgi:hypothetical protein